MCELFYKVLLKVLLILLTLSHHILPRLAACLQWHRINSPCFRADMMPHVCVHRRASWIGCTWSASLTRWWKSTPSPGYRRFTHTKVRVNQHWQWHFPPLLCWPHLNAHKKTFLLHLHLILSVSNFNVTSFDLLCVQYGKLTTVDVMENSDFTSLESLVKWWLPEGISLY